MRELKMFEDDSNITERVKSISKLSHRATLLDELLENNLAAVKITGIDVDNASLAWLEEILKRHLLTLIPQLRSELIEDAKKLML